MPQCEKRDDDVTEDGDALVVHSGEDDPRTEPAANPSDRIIWGVITR